MQCIVLFPTGFHAGKTELGNVSKTVRNYIKNKPKEAYKKQTDDERGVVEGQRWKTGY